MKILDAVKKRPMLVVGGTAALLVLVVVSRSGGGGTDYAAYSLEAQRLANDANLGAQGIQADIAAAQIQAGIARNESARDIILGSAQIKAESDMFGLGTMSSMFASFLSADVNKTELRTQQSIAQYATDASQTVALADMGSRYLMLDRSLNHEATMSREIMNNYNFNLPSIMAHEITMRKVDSQADLSYLNEGYKGEIMLAGVNGTPARIEAQNSRSAQRADSTGQAIKTIMSLFGG